MPNFGNPVLAAVTLFGIIIIVYSLIRMTLEWVQELRRKKHSGTPSRELEKSSSSDERANWWKLHPGEPPEWETRDDFGGESRE